MSSTPAAATDTANQTQVVILAVPRRLVAQIDHLIPPDAERQFAQRNARRHDRGRERARRDDVPPAGDTRADRGPADRRRVAVARAACGPACWREIEATVTHAWTIPRRSGEGPRRPWATGAPRARNHAWLLGVPRDRRHLRDPYPVPRLPSFRSRTTRCDYAARDSGNAGWCDCRFSQPERPT
jgi:hypothetical protein